MKRGNDFIAFCLHCSFGPERFVFPLTKELIGDLHVHAYRFHLSVCDFGGEKAGEFSCLASRGQFAASFVVVVKCSHH